MRRRGAATLTVMLTLLLGGAASAADAADPVTLGAEHVLDEAGALSPDEVAAAEDRLAQLSADTDVDLWVVFVDEFTNPSEADAWATETAEANGLGSNQYLLAVAVDARQYHLSADTSGPVSASEITSISQQQVQPALAEEDWPGAVDAAADGLEDAVDGGGSALTWILGLAALGAVIAVVVVVIARRRKAAEPEAPKVDLADLARRAASALVATDDAVKTSEQELGFAKAQFGDAATLAFEEALAAARENLAAAFALQQRLDDHEPDTPRQIQEWNEEILRLCAVSNTALDEKAADFDALRKLEQNAPEQLNRVRELHAAAGSALGGATAELAALRSAYAPDALAPVADNPEQAAQRLAFADEQLTAAEAALAAGDTGEAAVGIRAAEEAVAQAALLQKAIGTLGADLAAAEREVATLVAELEQDIVTAGALPDADGRVAAAVAATRREVDAARAQGATAKSPLAALAALEGADAQIDAVVSGVRDAQARAQRAQQALAQQLTQAQAQVSAAEDFIVARRGAVGAEARTRLAEAGAALVQARQLAPSSPEQALPLAQRANELAAQALRFAQTDVGAFSNGGYGGYPGGGGRGDSGMMGAVLGGIVLNSLLSGGGGRSGFGGSRGRSGGFGGGIRTGSFGGGATRGRRGGAGGRF